MPTARDYFDSIDKEAFAAKQVNTWANGKVGQSMLSGSKLKRLGHGFTVPPVLTKSPVGLKMKPPPLRAGLGGKPTWPKQTNPKYKPAGGSIVPDKEIRI